jgi:hypothetical protein
MKAWIAAAVLVVSIAGFGAASFSNVSRTPSPERPKGDYTRWAQPSTLNPYLNCLCVGKDGKSTTCMLSHQCKEAGGRCTAEGC